ncbi:MAG: dihydroxyacetone kinase subunit DhaK [Elusimicrobiota bacterium]|jgi:dihydroxyacetone kinase-like protein|nr:dihydroxyacetone kinase subunit DhaK [Elusimicrobiota bacterium]
MKKFLNDPKNFVDEMLEGILAAHPDQLSTAGELRSIVRAQKENKVSLMSGGGSGHLPLFMGYVGDGMLDGCAIGGVFQSPSPEQILKVTKAIDCGKGVLYVYGNYTGDIMNFEMSSELAETDNIKTSHILGADDVASAPKGEENKRRGVAGIFYVFKTAGAAAKEGADLEAVKKVAQKAAANVRTIGVALSPCTIPEIGTPSFNIGEDEMEIGMGIHGEPGIARTKLENADSVVSKMMEQILADMPLKQNDEISVLINGLGATPKEELYIVYRKVNALIKKTGAKVFNVYVGEFATSMEMSGFSISVFKLDGELKTYLAKPARSPFFEQRQL